MFNNIKKRVATVKSNTGLTLVELMVVIAILGVLIMMAFTIINPKHQISKIDDARREQDINQIKTALDIYYNDHNCYPTTLPFGSAWTEGSTTYMREIPQDLACVGNTNCYVYKYYGSCPQWNVVFAKLDITPDAAKCSLAANSACVPTDYDSSWACVVSGSLDSTGCTHLSSSSLSSGSDGAPPIQSPTPVDILSPTPTNSPTPTPLNCSKDYSCSFGTCNHVPEGTGDYCSTSCDNAC